MKKILITGGAGFLGCHLSEMLLKKGYRVRSLDLTNADDLPEDVEQMKGDIRDEKTLEKSLEGVSGVIHAAAALPLSATQEIFSVNVDGTESLLKKAFEQEVSRVVFISSTAVYGVPRVHPILEDHQKVGVGPYGQSKIDAEKIVEQYRQKGMIIPILSPKTFIGPKRLGVFQILFDWIDRGARIPLIGSGKNRYQLLDVEDLCSATLLLLEGEEKSVNQDFLVGARQFGTVEEDLQGLLSFADTGSTLLKTPAGLVKQTLRLLELMRLSPLYAWVYETADQESFVSTEKIEKTLGWTAKYSNAESLIRTYQWYQGLSVSMRFESGISHRRAWKQGALVIARTLLGGR